MTKKENKYIDVEKLVAELTKMQFTLNAAYRKPQSDNIVRAISLEYDDILSLVDSLQQEQPEVDLDEEIIAYIERHFHIRYDETLEVGNDPLTTTDFEEIARYFYELGFDTRKDKLPEIELDKFTEKIKTFQERYKHPEIVSIKGAMAFMARMFYQYPNVARQWYEQLPKATMDNAKKED